LIFITPLFSRHCHFFATPFIDDAIDASPLLITLSFRHCRCHYFAAAIIDAAAISPFSPPPAAEASSLSRRHYFAIIYFAGFHTLLASCFHFQLPLRFRLIFAIIPCHYAIFIDIAS
jgi:hypothetical protein